MLTVGTVANGAVSDSSGNAAFFTADADSSGIQSGQEETYVHELQSAHPMVLEVTEQEWLAVIVFIFWGLFAFLRIYNFNLYQYRWRAFFNFNIATQYFRDEGVLSTLLHALYHVHYLLGLSLLNVLVLPYLITEVPAQSIQVWVLGFAILLAAYVLRLLAGVVISEVFQLGEVLRFAQFYSNLTYTHLGYFLMPIVTIGLLSSVSILPLVSLWAGIVLLIIALVIRYIRGLQVVSQYFGLFQLRLIAYICTVEIAPVVIVVKTAQRLLFSQG